MRPARPDDLAAAGLLYVSAAPYYDAYAGSARRARKVLETLWPRPGHSASHEICHVAEVDGEIAGVLASFPSSQGDPLARRFLTLSLVRLPAWRWLLVARHLRASAAVTPVPPADALYVDALAVAEAHRRRGVARALLAEAERQTDRAGLSGVALDTGLENVAARALYAAEGFAEVSVHRAPNDRIARIVGGTGFVSCFKASAASGTEPRHSGR